jgi:hypothetical protein
MINLHDNETTSVKAARAWLEEHGGLLIKFENNNQRTIRFNFKGQRYEFDPNRIYTREGITATMNEFGRFTEAAADAVEQFAARVLQLIPEKNTCIVALHNNTDGLFSVTSYLPGHEREGDARMVTAQPEQDADDIFLTTDSLLYGELAGAGYNSIWQDKDHVKKDGSLSVYCAQKGLRYLNCETQHGKVEQYAAMIKVFGTYLLGGIPGGIIFDYNIASNEVAPLKGQDIWFGDKRIGVIISEPGSSGKFAIEPSFPLFTNMDLFLYRSENGQSRLELQIDPTRERVKLEAVSGPLKIVTRQRLTTHSQPL